MLGLVSSGYPSHSTRDRGRASSQRPRYPNPLRIRNGKAAPPMAAAPAPPPPPSPSPDARPPRVVRAPPRRPPPRAPGPPWAERRPAVSVDLDRGRRTARAEVAGVRAASLPARHRWRVEGTRWQRDWKVSEAAARVLALPPADAHAVDAVLNCWAGRYARRNFPLLIRVCPRAFFLARAMYSMQ